MANRDPYLVLGVAPVAPPEDIKVVYRKLSKEYHPDVNRDLPVAAQEKMKEITAAYQVVSNKQKREDYDKQPLFKPRVPKGFAAKAAAGVLKKRPPEKKKKSLLERFLAFAIVQPETTPRDPEKAQTHFMMGMTMTEKAAFYPEARDEFSAAMKADPQFLEAAFNYGLMCYKLGQFDEARVGFQRATRINPNDSPSRLLLDLIRPEDAL